MAPIMYRVLLVCTDAGDGATAAATIVVCNSQDDAEAVIRAAAAQSACLKYTNIEAVPLY